jgi:hypothetical protein
MATFSRQQRLLLLVLVLLHRISPNGSFQIFGIQRRHSPHHRCKCWSSNSHPEDLSQELSTVDDDDDEVDEFFETDMEEEMHLLHSFPFGGDFCGLSASFRVDTAEHIPIPQHWIPADLIKWNQAPTALDILVSEEVDTDGGDNENEGGFTDPLEEPYCTRQVTTILPATGCAVDNQESIRQTEFLKPIMNPLETDTVNAGVYAGTVQQPDKLLFEACFKLPDHHRARINFFVEDLDPPHPEDCYSWWQLVGPVTIQLERRYNETSSYGRIADGGGLDAQRVARLRGDWLKTQLDFATAPRMTTTDLLGFADESYAVAATTMFPGNFTLSSRTLDDGDFEFQIGHVIEGTSGHRVWNVVRATLSLFLGFPYELEERVLPLT